MRDVKKNVMLVLVCIAVLTALANMLPQQLPPTGMEVRTVSRTIEPQHAFLLPGVLLLIAIIGAHTLSHCCRHAYLRKYYIGGLVGSSILLAGVFALGVFSTPEITAATQRISSILAAIGVLFVFAVGSFEFLWPGKDKKHAWKEEKW